ncbi:hypothetical protein Tco_0520407 [Tanacetum coccineum]
MVRTMEDGLRAGGAMEAGDPMGEKRDCNFLGNKPSFPSILHEESSNKKVNLCTLVTDSTYVADVLIPLSSVLEVHASLGRVLEHGPWLICNVPFILRKWTPSSMLTKEELTFVYYHHMYANLGRMDYVRPLVGTRADRALKDTVVISVPDPIGNGVMMHTIKQGGTSNDGFQSFKMKDFRGPLGSKKGTVGNHNLPKQQMPKYACQKKTTSTPVSNSFSALEEDSEKLMDDLVDDTLKKIEAPPKKKTPKKTSIWSRRKADSPKRNVVFSPETKVHYFDKDDLDFDNTGQVVEKVEQRNAYSEIG